MGSFASAMALRLLTEPSAAALCCLVLGGIITYSVYISIYNSFFHPLAKLPGTWFAAISEWFLIVWICAVPTYGLQLHRKYGDIEHCLAVLPRYLCK
jgi:hypothetical protein